MSEELFNSPQMNRLYRLDGLQSHCETDWLEQSIYLPPWVPGERVERRIWLATPSALPTLQFDTVTIAPVTAHAGALRWVDYGPVTVPAGPSVCLRVCGLPAADTSCSYLVISTALDVELAGKTVRDAERLLFGFSREEVGRTAIFPNRVTVGEPVTFRIDYEAGSRGLPVGTLLRFSVPRLFSPPQAESADAPGFLRLLHAEAELELSSIDLSVDTHERFDIIFTLRSDLHLGGRVRLCYSTVDTYIMASTWRQEDMRQWWSPVPPLNASVSPGDPNRWVYPLPGHGHSVRFEAGPPTRLHLFLPGRRCVGQELPLRGIMTDRFRNPTDARCADWPFDLFLEGGAGDSRPLAAEAMTRPEPNTFRCVLPPLTEGVYRVVARAKSDGAILSRSNPLEVIPADQPERQIFWGELHTHSERSDGIGRFRDLYRHARDVGALEFVSASDHDSFTDNDWLQMQDVARSFHRPGVFCALCGFEWQETCVYSWNDRLERPVRGEARVDPEALFDTYRGRSDVVMGPHGHINHLSPIRAHDPELQRFVQVYGTFGGCDAWDNPFLNPLVHSKNKPERVATDILREGCKLGFTGGGDIHSAHPGFSAEMPDSQGQVPCDQYHSHLYHDGMTAAIMPELDRKPLIKALRDRRTYATSGPRILLDFSVSGIAMGGEGTTDRALCRLTVHAVDELDYVDIVKDGEVAWKRELQGLDAEDVQWEDSAPVHDEHFYYARVRQKNGEMAWSSPVWVQGRAFYINE